MFSSRNIHFAILGIILGAAAGYIFAFYQVQRNAPAGATSGAPSNASSGTGTAADPQNHPDVTPDQMVELFKQAIEKNPDEPELMTKYADFLFTQRKFAEAAEWYKKVLALEPANLNVRTDMATALWNMGDTKGATVEYEAAIKIDPNHVPTIHNLVVAHMDGDGDLQKAAALLKRIEELDPKYSALPGLQVKFEERQRRGKTAQ